VHHYVRVLNLGQHRRRQAVVLFGAAAAAVTMTALGQAPAAHADDFSTLTADISQIYSDSQTFLTNGLADLESGQIEGLSAVISGLDDALLTPEEEFALGSLDLATGAPVVSPDYLELTLQPEDLNEVLAANAKLLPEISTALQIGLTDLEAGNINGLADFLAISNAVLVGDPELFGVGAIYSCSGFSLSQLVP
jgi:hypothetical protein